MKAIDLYLRPLSDFHTGTVPYIEEKVASVEEIEVAAPKVSIQQQSEIKLKSGNEIKNQTVPHPDRHWWGVVADDWFKRLDNPLRHHGDLVDFVTTLNLCTDAAVAFSQSPGRIVGGYHQVDEQGRFNYRDNLSSGPLGIQSVLTKEISDHITVSDEIPRVYERVREVRETETTSESDSDLLIALHMYDDALTGTRWTCLANLFYVCENALCSGFRTDPEQRIVEETTLNHDEAKAWGNMVNRLKHPDKSSAEEEVPTTLLEMVDDETTVPELAKMRRAANTAPTTSLIS